MITKTCLICGKHFSFKRLCRKDTAKYCSRNCYYQSRTGYKHSVDTIKKMKNSQTGEKHWNWNGGKYIQLGYLMVRVSSNKYIRNYRLIVEKILGRELSAKEVIHHINGDKLDDNPTNLYLFESQSDHITFHHLVKKPVLKSNF